MKFSAGFVMVLAGVAVVMLLFVVNIALAARHGSPSRRVTLALYGIASIVVLFNFLRGVGTETIYVLVAHGVVLFSIIISLRRYLGETKEDSGGISEEVLKDDSFPR